MFKAQFGEAEYSDVAFTISTRIDAAGCFGVIEYCTDKNRTQEMTKLTVIQNGEEKPALEFKNFISRGDQNDSYNRVLKPDGYCGALNCTKEMEVLEPIKINHVFQVIQVGNIVEDKGFSNPQRGRVYDAEGISPAICTMQSGGTEPKIVIAGYVNDGKHQQDFVQHEDGICRTICTGTHASTPHLLKTIVSVQNDNLLIPQATKEGFISLAPGGVFDGSYQDSTTRRGRVQEGGQVTPTLTTSGDNLNLYEEVTYRIRKLTPRECYRLMGVDDADIDIIQSSGISNTQQYKQAGNSIVVDVLFHIFRKMFVEVESESRQLEFF